MGRMGTRAMKKIPPQLDKSLDLAPVAQKTRSKCEIGEKWVRHVGDVGVAGENK